MNASQQQNKVLNSFNHLVSLINDKKGSLLSLLGKRPREFEETTWETSNEPNLREPAIELSEPTRPTKYQAVQTATHHIERLPARSFRARQEQS